jgi:lipoprotein-anchoring transpeptidase ErfK/SrfK
VAFLDLLLAHDASHQLSKSKDPAMRSRLLPALGLAACLLPLLGGSLQAQSFFNDPEGRFSGGAPHGGLFAASPIPRTNVSFPGNYAPGTIVINTGERRLYYVLGNGEAVRYGIGVGRLGFSWAGVTAVSAKREWPDWNPPAQMLRRRPDLPRHMVGGVDNPLGARAMYLGSSMYRIHGSNEPETIGQAVSSGCFRMTNEDVMDLYPRVQVGAKVIVLR